MRNRLKTPAGTVVPALLALAFTLGARESRAEQFVLFDETFTFTWEDANSSSSHYFVTDDNGLNPERPTDWTNPVDYRNGTVHVRVEVISKPPGDEVTQWTLCYIPVQGQGNGYGCTGSGTYTEAGVYERDVSMTSWWENQSIVWNRGIDEMHLVMKDSNGGNGHVHFRPNDQDLFLPTTMRITMVQVSAGDTYDPVAAGFGDPENPGEGGAGGAPAEGGAANEGGAPGEAGAAGEGGAPPIEPPPAVAGSGGETNEAAVPPVMENDPGAIAAAGADPGFTEMNAAAGSSSESGGCALAPSPRDQNSARGLLITLAFGVGLMRRRR